MTDTKTNQVKLPSKSIKINESKRIRVAQPKKGSPKEHGLKQTRKTVPQTPPVPTPHPNKKPERPGISPDVVDELRDMSKEGRIKKEVFLEFLRDKDLLEKKKEVVARLAAFNIKIMRKKKYPKP